MAQAKKKVHLYHLRAAVQFVFFALFTLVLLFSSASAARSVRFIDAFFYLDPLLALTLFLITGTALALFLWSLVGVGLTLVIGRFFCGWVCPFGAVQQFFTWIFRRRNKNRAVDPRWLRVKYLVLLVVLVSLLFSTQFTGWFDPFSLFTRSGAVAVFPAANYLTQHTLEVGASGKGPLAKAVKPVYDFGRRHVLTLERRTFTQSIFIGLIFFLIAAANFFHRRFYCNVVCPLGALYGWLARFSFLRLEVRENCLSCNACSRNCPYSGSPFRDYLKSECLLCLNCLADCPVQAVRFRFALPRKTVREGVDLSRRHLVGSLSGGLIAAALPQITILKKKKTHDFLRPPGSVAEKEFLKRCIRCGACMQACPTNAVQPALLQAGLEGMWTPVLVPANNYCEYECHQCTQVCPTRAIERLSLDEKKKFKIGTAVVDRNRCYTYADGYNCAVCEEHCPVPDKAIKFREVEVHNFRGRLKKVKQIYVVPDLCIGCGICERVCPRLDAPGIVATAEEEQREAATVTTS